MLWVVVHESLSRDRKKKNFFFGGGDAAHQEFGIPAVLLKCSTSAISIADMVLLCLLVKGIIILKKKNEGKEKNVI